MVQDSMTLSESLMLAAVVIGPIAGAFITLLVSRATTGVRLAEVEKRIDSINEDSRDTMTDIRQSIGEVQASIVSLRVAIARAVPGAHV